MHHITVVLPVFNGSRYLAQAIDSILRQDLGDFTVLVGDDASTDGSADIVAGFDDRRIRLIRREANLGLFANLNALLGEVSTPLVHFFCQDDVMRSDALSATVGFLAGHSDVQMSFCKSRQIDSVGRIVAEAALHDMPDVLPSSLALQLFGFFGCLPANVSAVAVRTRSIEDAGGFDETMRVSSDYDMWVRLCRDAPVGVIHDHLFDLRGHSEQLSRVRRSGIDAIRENARIKAQLLTYLPPEAVREVRRHWAWRQDALAFHHSARCLLQGDVSDALDVVRILGPAVYLRAGLAWLATGNNHWWRPAARIQDLP